MLYKTEIKNQIKCYTKQNLISFLSFSHTHTRSQNSDGFLKIEQGL